MKILGLMSGTSGDGIDGAVAEFFDKDSFKFLWHKTVPFSKEQFLRIKHLVKSADAQSVTLGHTYLSELYAAACFEFFKGEPILPDYIAAHGQTIWHQPQIINWDGLSLSGTLQLLDGFVLSQKVKLPVIYNFRQADMAVGGQGAPLVPFADIKMFGAKLEPGKKRIVLNLGGMANVTVIKGSLNGPIIEKAFDTGPGNALMDEYMQMNLLGQYDLDGSVAASGNTCDKLLEKLLNDPYLRLKPPKSTGREYFNINNMLENMKNLSHKDAMSTLSDFTVESIYNSIEEYLLDTEAIIIAGGGALNKELMRRFSLKELVANCEVKSTDEYGIPVMAREALAFSILGNAFLHKEPGNIIAATGASKPVVLGSYASMI